NWAEDQAPPMDFGVYPDYGFRETQTTAREQFAHPSRQGKHLIQGQGVRFGMVTPATYKAAQYALSADRGDVAVGADFDAVIKTHGKTEAARYFETTSRADFGGSGAKGRFEQLAERSAKQSAAGGPGAPRPGRGLRASATVGEMWKDSADPKESTAAQRSWLPGGDPGLIALHGRRVAKPVHSDHASLQVGGATTGAVKAAKGSRVGCETAAFQAPTRRTVITGTQEHRSLQRGYRVFADE
ncbi:unnamed protein product, partial [Symbiodinium sp. KB8]